MMNTTGRILILLTSFAMLNLVVHGRKGVWFKKFQYCDPKADYDVMFNFTVTSSNNKQYLDGTAIFKSDFDNTVMSNVSVDMLVGNEYMYLFSVSERKSCEAVHKYMGEFAYDVERNAQLIPGMCPVAKGKYRLHHFPLDYQKISTLVNFPLGNLRFTDVAMKNNNIYTCLIAEVENHGYF